MISKLLYTSSIEMYLSWGFICSFQGHMTGIARGFTSLGRMYIVTMMNFDIFGESCWSSYLCNFKKAIVVMTSWAAVIFFLLRGLAQRIFKTCGRQGMFSSKIWC